MILFGDEQNKSLSEGLANSLSAPLIYPEITVFPDGERRIRLTENVVDEEIVFVKTSSITPNVDSLIVETALLIDAFKRSGSSQITGIIPYVPYSRADHVFRSGEAVPLEIVINMYESSGLNKIVFVDPHTIKMPEMFGIDVLNLSALTLFADKIREIGFDRNDSVIVSPDMGGLRRMEQLSGMLDELPFTSIVKERDYATGHISASAVQGEVKRKCFIIDDIISSGNTIVQAIDKLSEMGAEQIYVFATHPVFSGDASRLLENSKAERIYITDSIPVRNDQKFERLEVLTIAPLVANNL